MATTDIQYGGTRRLWVASQATPTTDAHYVVMENDSSFTLTRSRETTKHKVKGMANVTTAAHKKDYALKADAEMIATDPALGFLAAAFEAGTPIRIQERNEFIVTNNKVNKVVVEGPWNVESYEAVAADGDVVKVSVSLSPAGDITVTPGGRALNPA